MASLRVSGHNGGHKSPDNRTIPEVIVDVESLTAILSPVLERHGLELDHLQLIPAGRRTVLRITVDGDGPAGRGPLLDDIAVASNDLSATLDTSPVVGNQAYTLEVSSRGVSSPLTSAKHFRRNAGRLIKADLSDGTHLLGRIGEVTEDAVTLQIAEPTTKGRPAAVTEQIVVLADVTKAVVQIEMNRPLQPGLDDVEVGDDDLDEEDE
jgi:ribosome maturation factor RimP